MDARKSIQLLQLFVDGLRQGAFAHYLQGKYFEALNLPGLAKHYAEHYTEEMEWVDKFITRITDLNGDIWVQATEAYAVIKDPVEYLRWDLEQQEHGVEILRNAMAQVADDPVTYRLLLDYLEDEEGDLNWLRAQPDIVERAGLQNWYATLL